MPRHHARPTLTFLLRHRSLLAAALALSAAGFAHAADADAEYQAAVASCKAAPKPVSRYVSVTAALMRPVPRSDGGLVTRVPIATEVKVECELEGWVRGHTDGDAPAVGWIRADLLQAKPPTVESLAADYAGAAADQRKTLAERWVALAPYQARGHQALIETLQAAGDSEGARRASEVRDQLLHPKGERLNGEPKLLFAVDRGWVVALARVEDGGTYRATDLEAEAGYYPPRRGLHFYRRGRADGAVQVLESRESVSVGLEAPVRHSSMTARSDKVVGLAANFALDAKSAGTEDAISPAARKAIESELRAVLQGEKIDRAQIDKALKARPSDEDRGGVQIAAFQAGKLGTLHVATLIWNLPPQSENALETTVDVALILESDGKGGLKTTGRLTQQTGGDVVESHRYFDRLDIDGDGVPELIFQVGRYEGVEYQIWTRGSGQWKSALTGGYVGA